MLYFAYGSNLSSRRLRKRVPSARVIATGALPGHRLCFHKIGRDGSAKCNACFTGKVEDRLLGAVYRIASHDKPSLDAAEGLGKGYEIRHASICTGPGNCGLHAFLYFATRIDTSILPFSWYLRHVLEGAREHCFPDEYVREIEKMQGAVDPESWRADHENRLYSSPLP